MRLIPAIDLRAGHCVRLLRGDFSRETRYDTDAAVLAEKYRSLGADWLHVVDLDGAKGDGGGNRNVIMRMAVQAALKMQVGGGLRDADAVRQMLDLGVARVVIGSAAVTHVDRVRTWLDHFGPERLTLAFDVRLDADGAPRVATHGWQQQSELSLWERGRTLRGFIAQACVVHRCGPRRRIDRAECAPVPGGRAPPSADPLAGFGRHPRSARPAGTGRGRSRRCGQRQGTARKSDSRRGFAAILAKRIIPCLDVRDGQVVKGVRFRDHRVVGDILDLAGRYRDAGADELVFYDISASPEGRSVDRSWIARVARLLDIPFCVAGGICSVAQAEAVLAAGAEKISVNSPALARPELIDELSRRFGAQCVVVGVDSQTTDLGYRVQQYTGDAARSRDTSRSTVDWIIEAQRRGAGEIVLNCMASDGVRRGFDIDQLRTVRAVCQVPLVASGGAGATEHFTDVFQAACVDAALAASVFHSGEIEIHGLKRGLRSAGIEVRL